MTDQEQIAAAEESLWAAVMNENKYALYQLLHQEMVFLDHRGQVVTDPKDPYTYRFGNLHLDQTNICDRQINTTGNTAMVLVIEKIRAKRKSMRVEGRYLHMRVWKRKEGSWKIAAFSSSAMPVMECVVSGIR
ncbi:MAG: nuclear transport factor 2 family protein [Dyadobacter sp.]|uniref:nuclear transport factor 2 family protein n=1 Tax=Dyadobacter sp. TaxID=1914288 RepID=UPI0032656CC8